MKFLSLLLAFSLALTIPAFAHESYPTKAINVTITAVAEKSVQVIISNLQQQTTRITIESLDGSVVYFKDIVKKHNGYHKRLNLRKLKDGKYLLVVQQGNKKHQQVIVLKDTVGMLLSAGK